MLLVVVSAYIVIIAVGGNDDVVVVVVVVARSLSVQRVNYCPFQYDIVTPLYANSTLSDVYVGH